MKSTPNPYRGGRTMKKEISEEEWLEKLMLVIRALSNLIRIAAEGHLFRPLIGEMLTRLNRMNRKAQFFEHIMNKQPQNYPNVLELFGNFFLFLWGGDKPDSFSLKSSECFNEVKKQRDLREWKDIYFHFNKVGFENLSSQHFVLIRDVKRIFIFYFDGTYIVNYPSIHEDEINKLLSGHPTMIFELDFTQKNELHVVGYAPTHYGQD